MVRGFRTIGLMMVGVLFLQGAIVDRASAATVRRTFNLNAGSPFTGGGFFDYDDAALTAGISGQTTPILMAEFTYSGGLPQLIDDPLSAVNFDSLGAFLGIDLVLPAPAGEINNVLIANEDAYIPEDASQPFEGVVSYGAAVPTTAIPTPALLPGLVALGWKALRQRRETEIKSL
jgi:hypothetical protein